MPDSSIISILLVAMLIAACEQAGTSIQKDSGNNNERIDIDLRSGNIVTVHSRNVPPVSLMWGEDAIFVEQNLGEGGEPNRISGNIVKIWLKNQEGGRIWIRRNSSDEEMKQGAGDRSTYEDQDADGVVDYKRNGDGVFRVAEIVWEKIGDLPAVPPDQPNHRVDAHRMLSEAAPRVDQIVEEGDAGQPATRSEADSERGDKPQTESKGRSR